MDMARLAATRHCEKSAAASDSDDVGQLEGNY